MFESNSRLGAAAGLALTASFALGPRPAAAVDLVPVNGTVSTAAGTPLCAMVLANGEHAFTCSGDGSFRLNVPLDGDGQVSVQAFCSGRASYKTLLAADQGTGLHLVMDPASSSAAPQVSAVLSDLPDKGRVNLRGVVSYRDQPVCAMALANGVYAFTCSGDGSYSLDVPVDDNRRITLYAFVSGLVPFQQTFQEAQLPDGWDQPGIDPASMAVIDQNNAEKLALDSFMTSYAAVNSSVLGMKAVVDGAAVAAGGVTPAVVRQYTVAGRCGGTAVLDLDVSPITGNFTVPVVFHDYCSGAMTADGALSMVGQIELPSGLVRSATATLTDLAVALQASGLNAVLDGTIAVAFEGSDAAVFTMNVSVTDPATGKTARIEDMRAAMSGMAGPVYTLTLEGRYYHPDHGYVGVSTPTPFQGSNDDGVPFQGQLVVTGANAGSARLTILSSGTYQVEADLDGDGVYEFSSGVLDW